MRASSAVAAADTGAPASITRASERGAAPSRRSLRLPAFGGGPTTSEAEPLVERADLAHVRGARRHRRHELGELREERLEAGRSGNAQQPDGLGRGVPVGVDDALGDVDERPGRRLDGGLAESERERALEHVVVLGLARVHVERRAARVRSQLGLDHGERVAGLLACRLDRVGVAEERGRLAFPGRRTMLPSVVSVTPASFARPQKRVILDSRADLTLSSDRNAGEHHAGEHTALAPAGAPAPLGERGSIRVPPSTCVPHRLDEGRSRGSTGGSTIRAFPVSPSHMNRVTKRKPHSHAAENGPAWIRTRARRIMSPLL